MLSLSEHSKSTLKEAWVVQKIMYRFSSIPIDQAHEQENAKVKGNGGIVGLTESPSALKQWFISGPEKSRILSEYDKTLFEEVKEDFMHHEEGSTYRTTFGKEVKSLVESIEHFGNPFSETSSDLLVLHSQECVNEDVIRSIYSLESIGKEQYKKFHEEVFEKQTKTISDTIKKNKLILFKTSNKMKPTKSSQIQGLKNDVLLFGRLYIANQQCEGDPATFFPHENQAFPPSLSENGKPLIGKKSDLLKCLVSQSGHTEETKFDCKIFDGASLVHMLKPTAVCTFKEYADQIFFKFLRHQLQHINRIDVVWDQYWDESIKCVTRTQREPVLEEE